jgi:hypothetical protein
LFIGVTVRTVESEMPLQVAVSVVIPVENEVARPLEPDVLLIVATDGDDELQLARAVSTCVVLSGNVAVAVNCCVAPKVMVLFVGAISKDAITANVAEPEMLPDEAVIVIFIVPALDEVVTRPVLPIGASVVSEELHATEVVRSCFVPFEYVPVAVNCCVAPEAMIGFAGVTAIEVSVAVDVLAPPPPLQLIINKGVKTKNGSLFNFIEAHSLRYQCRRIGTALQVAHMSPFLHNDTVCFYRDVPAARLPVSMSQGFLILRRIGSKERRQIGMSQSVPGDTEDDT